uniref:Uncharacterized protein n=1 Tax=Solanum lycopersicum TaxID=4081 RepID=A0A3Q7FMI1_SOLLC
MGLILCQYTLLELRLIKFSGAQRGWIAIAFSNKLQLLKKYCYLSLSSAITGKFSALGEKL